MKKIVAILMFGVALLWANSLAKAEEQARNVEKCKADDAQACYEIKEYKKACDLGLGKACFGYAWDVSGRDIKAKYYKKACELGYSGYDNRDSCVMALTEMTDWENRFWGKSSDTIYKQSLEEARVWLRKMCLDEANLLMCWLAISTPTNASIMNNGEIHFKSVGKPLLLIAGDERDKFKQKFEELFEPLLQEYSKKCDEGETNTCVLLGRAFLNGYMRVWDRVGIKSVEIAKNTAKAREFLQKACDAGEVETCKRYELTQDMSKSEPILQKACESGNTEACLKLGAYYDKDDDKKAIEFYQKACDLGDTKTCSKFGAEYWFKAGCILGIFDKQSCADYHLVATEEPSKKAKEFYKKSCDFGNELGCSAFYLYDAKSYNVGLGVSQDIAKAKELYKKACDDFKTGCKYFERLSK